MIKVIMEALKLLGIGSIVLQLVKKDVLMIPVANTGHGIKLILRRINVTCFLTKELLLMILLVGEGVSEARGLGGGGTWQWEDHSV